MSSRPEAAHRFFIPSAILLALAVHLPYLSGAILPLHDTLQNAQSFHMVFNSLRFDGEIPFWVPYGLYGLANDINLWATLPPMAWAMMPVGLALGMMDTLLLFKIAMILQVVLYAFGMALLARRLFRSWLAHWVILLTAVGSVVWIKQIFMGMQIFYLLPLVLYALLRFREEENPRWFWLASLLGLLSMHGSLHYIAFVQTMVVTLFLVPLLLEKPRLLRSLLKPELGALLLLGLVLLLMAVEGYYLLHNLDGLYISEDRDPETGLVTLENFINYARPAYGALINGILTGAYSMEDYSYYIGLMPLGLFIGGLFVIRARIFWGLALGALSLLWLSAGGWFATGLYYLWPGMNMVRHIGGFNAIATMLMLLACGFVLERIHVRLTAPHAGPSKETAAGRFGPFPQWLWATLLLLGWALDVAFHDGREAGLAHLLDTIMINDALWRGFFLFRMGVMELGILLLIVLIWVAAPRAPKGRGVVRWGAGLLLLMATLDIGSYRLQSHLAASQYQAGAWEDLFISRPMPYRPQRLDQPMPGSRADQALHLIKTPIDFFSISYAMSFYPFAELDPCFPQMTKTKIQVMNLPVERMLAGLFDDRFFSHVSTKMHHTPAFFRGRFRADFIQSLGCGQDKMTLLRHPQLARDDQHARRLFKQSPDMAQSLILVDPPGVLKAKVLHTQNAPEPSQTSEAQQEAQQEGWGPEADGAAGPAGAGWTDETAPQTLLPEAVAGSAQVQSFSANRMQLTVSIKDGKPAWLLYRDGYHPHWRAWVDDQEVAVARANIGFKAIWLPPGVHQVRFHFDHGLMGNIGTLLALLSTLGGRLLAGGMLATAFYRPLDGALS